MNPERRQALDRIAELVRQHGLTLRDIRSRLEESAPAGGDPDSSNRLTTLLAYLGALFVFSGLVTFINMIWPGLGSAARVIATLGSGVITLVLALVAERDQRFRPASLPLYVMAALLQPAGLFVCLNEYSAGGDTALGATAVFAVVWAQAALLFVKLGWTRLVFFIVVYAVATLSSLMTWLDLPWALTTLTVSVSGLLVTVGLRDSDHAVLCPVLYPTFALALACGAFDLLHDEFLIDFGLLGVGAALIVLSVAVRSRALLGASVVITLAYLGYYTDEYFAGMLGWPISLIALGMLMIGLSSYAVRLGRRLSR